MKRLLVVLLLITLAGCAAPWGQPAPDETTSSPAVEINNSSEDYAYIIGTLNEDVESQTVFFNNTRNEGEVEVAVTVHPSEDTSESVSLVLGPSETAEIKLNQSTDYTITVAEPYDQQYNISSGEFDCNYKTHQITINESSVDRTVMTTTMACPDIKVQTPTDS